MSNTHRKHSPPSPGVPALGRCRRTLSFVYGLMSHCIDRFHFVFYFYTFHFMFPMCIRLIFFGLGHPRWACGSKKILIFRIGSKKRASGGKKSSFFDFWIAPKRVLTCGFERARRELPESSIISEKGAIHVELWPKHSK